MTRPATPRAQAGQTRDSAASRRRHSRIPVPPISVSGEWSAVKDIAVGGISLAHPDPLQPGTRFRLLITDAFRGDATELDAEVVWCKGGWVGLCWADPDAAAQEWLEEHCREWQEESVLAQLAQCLAETDLPTSSADFTRRIMRQAGQETPAPEPVRPEPPADGPPMTLLIRKASSEVPSESAALEAPSGDAWWRGAMRAFPWALAAALAGLCLGIAAPRFPERSERPAADFPQATAATPAAYLGAWAFYRNREIVFTETLERDGTWTRQGPGSPAGAQRGRWSECNGMITMTATGPDGSGASLPAGRRWWAHSADGLLVTMTAVDAGGSLLGEAARPER